MKVVLAICAVLITLALCTGVAAFVMSARATDHHEQVQIHDREHDAWQRRYDAAEKAYKDCEPVCKYGRNDCDNTACNLLYDDYIEIGKEEP